MAPRERLENLAAFRTMAARGGIDLLIVHPAYRDSVPHECLLTAFVREHGVATVEAGLALHPAGRRRGALFRDSWHPVAEGHARLAALLADEIARRFR